MRHWKLLLGATAALAALTACGGGGGYGQQSGNAAPAAPAASGAVSVKDVNGVGKTLVDSAGKTLYFAYQEADGAIKCTAGCLDFWFPVEGTDSTAKSMEGLAVVTRSDTGKSQLTYQGKPLYTFKLDTGPGKHQGNNVTDEFNGTTFRWHAATTTAAAPSQAPSSTDNDYGNGY
jgi:predicted lipoprotein with Yx(FWY)xxD motif